VVTDMGVLECDPQTKQLVLTAVHPGVDVEAVRAETEWDLRVSDDLRRTEPPTVEELTVLRELTSR
jgi:glutaconate CoA-transferase subunit B